MQAEDAAGAEISRAIDVMLEHLACARSEAADCFAEDAALYGSERHEVAIGREAIRAFLIDLFAAAGRGPRFKLQERRISAEGEVAWFAATYEVAIGGQVVAPYRLSGVLVRRDGRWTWTLFNGSEPLPPRG
jgi:ketosteroid isomerase-like protein